MLMAISVQAFSQAHGIEAGARLGGNMWQTSDLTSKIGFTYGIDVAYSCRWTLKEQVQIGPRVGLSLAHSAGGFSKDDINEQFVNTDYLGNAMAYTIHGSAEQSLSNWQAEVPVMLSMNIYNVIVNVGAKMVYILSGKAEQTLSDNMITATYTAYHVDVTNELITGLMSPDYKSMTFDHNLPKLHAMISAEIGYRWEVAEQNFIGLAAYFNYGIWSNSSTNEATGHLVYVDPISNPVNPVASVHVGQLQTAYSLKANYMDFGIKLYYQFEYSDYKYHGWHRRWR